MQRRVTVGQAAVVIPAALALSKTRPEIGQNGATSAARAGRRRGPGSVASAGPPQLDPRPKRTPIAANGAAATSSGWLRRPSGVVLAGPSFFRIEGDADVLGLATPLLGGVVYLAG